jgi:MFS transporter, NNP family, nitrate/nitrite transporter
MGSLYGEYGTYAAGLALLAIVAAAALAYTLTGVRAAAEGGEREQPTSRRRGHRTAGTTA